MTGDTITREFLIEAGFGKNQIETFSGEWPNDSEITLPNLLRAADLSFDLEWLAHRFLSPEARKLFND